MPKLRYDYNLLKDICDKHDITLLVDYKDKFITRDTIIIGKCILCDNRFNKRLNDLYKHKNFGCNECTKTLKFDRIKKTMVHKYGVEYAAQSQQFKDKMKNTTFERYGLDYALQSDEVKEKIKETNLEKYGFEYGLQNEEVKEKRRLSNLERYGFENPLQREEIREKIKETNLAKYGVEHASQCQSVKDKAIKTNMENHGVAYFTQTNIMKEKTIKTNLERYGVEHNLQRAEIKNKIKATNLEKYGFEYAMHNPAVMEKQIKSSYYLKDYVLPSGNIIKIQGFEHYALDELLKVELLEETDIITGCNNVPTIWYNDENGKKHRHFVDIFIPSKNKCVEVKSTWTFQTQKAIVFLKQSAAKALGYLYEIWVYDEKGKKVSLYE
jgi:hypothetical protein